MKYFYVILATLVIVILGLFAYYNSGTMVVVDFKFYQSESIPLYLAIYSGMAIVVFFMSILGIIDRFRFMRKSRKLKAKIEDMESDIEKYRILDRTPMREEGKGRVLGPSEPVQTVSRPPGAKEQMETSITEGPFDIPKEPEGLGIPFGLEKPDKPESTIKVSTPDTTPIESEEAADESTKKKGWFKRDKKEKKSKKDEEPTIEDKNNEEII